MLKGIKSLAAIICLGSLVIIISIITYALTTVHVTGVSSVDGGEIRWESSTQFTTERDFAINLWNSQGAVDILADDWYSNTDLTFLDCNEEDVEWCGRYVSVPIVDDEIQLNTYYFQNYSAERKKKTVAHELGHALGIGDHYEWEYSLCIMYGYSSTQNSISGHDQSDYNEIY